MTTKQKLITAEEFLLLEEDDRRLELVDGVLQEKAVPGELHGEVAANFIIELGGYRIASGVRGRLVAEVGYILRRNPDTVRLPDVAWISGERAARPPLPGFPEGAPDLAVEVKSPTDTYAEMERKGQRWLEFGCRLVWVAYPERRTIAVHRPGLPPVTLGEDDTLDGGELLPGFSVPVRRIFGRPE